MLIDWFTVIAQVVNFLVLVWLMKYFLYTPILKAIDTREKRIANELATASAKNDEAEKERNAYKRRIDEFDSLRESLTRDMAAEIKSERQKLLEDLRRETELQRKSRMDGLMNEYINAKKEIDRIILEQVMATTRKVLVDLADSDLERHMVQAFERRCKALDKDQTRALSKVLNTKGSPVLIRSSSVLSESQQLEIETMCKELFCCADHFRFATTGELVCGIELSVNGYAITWSIAEYLSKMEELVADPLAAVSSLCS